MRSQHRHVYSVRSAHTVLAPKLAAFCFSCLSKFSRRRTQDCHEEEAHGRGESPSAIGVNTRQGSWRYPCGRSACVLTAVEVVAGGVSAEGGQDSATPAAPQCTGKCMFPGCRW